jgi:hypothetical protein
VKVKVKEAELINRLHMDSRADAEVRSMSSQGQGQVEVTVTVKRAIWQHAGAYRNAAFLKPSCDTRQSAPLPCLIGRRHRVMGLRLGRLRRVDSQSCVPPTHSQCHRSRHQTILGPEASHTSGRWSYNSYLCEPSGDHAGKHLRVYRHARLVQTANAIYAFWSCDSPAAACPCDTPH